MCPAHDTLAGPMAVEMSWRRPADYYSSGAPERVLPQWAPYGCGGAALLVLILVFVGGAYASRGGLAQFMDLAFGLTMSEMRGMYTKDVTAEQKAALEREVAAMRKNLREETISVQTIEPVLQVIRKASADEKISRSEIDVIVAAVKKVNEGSKAQRLKGSEKAALSL